VDGGGQKHYFKKASSISRSLLEEVARKILPKSRDDQ
jgi:hypothetical protein